MINGRDGVINIEAATRLVEDQRIDYETRVRLDPGTVGLVDVSCPISYPPHYSNG